MALNSRRSRLSSLGNMKPLGSTDLSIFPLNLGGNVFGFTADETASHLVLDAFAERGGNFIDTADSYSSWAPGNSGGESETIIGNWHKKRGNRDSLVIATKVSEHPGRQGLEAANVKAAAEDSLRRLQTDHIDLYYAHFDHTETPLEETLAAFDELVREGKVRYVAGSNYSPERIREALAIQDREGFARWVALQPHYNLVEREEFENGGRREIAETEGLAVIPYYALAEGFLTGKYRKKDEPGESPRAGDALKHLDERGLRVLDVLDEVAAAHEVPVAAIAIAWLNAQPTIAAALASARTPEQLEPLMTGAELALTAEELTRLGAASRPA
jgi:aryl-alcohol dehydrogenase-like predicted oxidoreductase